MGSGVIMNTAAITLQQFKNFSIFELSFKENKFGFPKLNDPPMNLSLISPLKYYSVLIK